MTKLFALLYTFQACSDEILIFYLTTLLAGLAWLKLQNNERYKAMVTLLYRVGYPSYMYTLS